MKKFGIRFTLLFMIAALISITALAVSGKVRNLNVNSRFPNVEINEIGEEAQDPVFNIKQTQVEDGKFYTVIIRSGTENDDPSENNIVYINVVKAENGSLDIPGASKKDWAAGSYRVYLSDYSSGKIEQVATFDVVENSIEPSTRLLGDVDGDGEITVMDAGKIIDHVIELKTLNGTDFKAADVDEDDDVTVMDAGKIIDHIIELKTIENKFIG